MLRNKRLRMLSRILQLMVEWARRLGRSRQSAGTRGERSEEAGPAPDRPSTSHLRSRESVETSSIIADGSGYGLVDGETMTEPPVQQTAPTQAEAVAVPTAQEEDSRCAPPPTGEFAAEPQPQWLPSEAAPNAEEEGPRAAAPFVGDLEAGPEPRRSHAGLGPNAEEEGPRDAATRVGDLSTHPTPPRSPTEPVATQSPPASLGSGAHECAVVSGGISEPPKASSGLLRKPQIDGPEDRQPRQIRGRRINRPQPSPEKKAAATAERRFVPRPELICRQVGSSGAWEVVVRADQECAVENVRQNGTSLVRVDGEYGLVSLRGTLSITTGGREPYDLVLFQGNPLIFKTPADWHGDGRWVGSVTVGCFIVIAPTEWTRLGSASVAAAPCTDTGFMAHYYFVSREDLSRGTEGFDQHKLALTQARYSLSGDRVFDDSDNGELFVGHAPKLDTTADVVWARVGEEEQDGWRGTNFKPAERLLADVLDGRQGRFFVRVFDAESKLLDSGEFRYLRGLREIRVEGATHTEDSLLAPAADGHAPLVIHFAGVDRVIPAPSQVRAAEQSGGRVVVEPHPDGDVLQCVLEAGAGRVGTTIRLGRIWWRMKNGSQGSDAWRGTTLALTRQQFRRYADADASIELRLPRHVGSVSAGFDDALNRNFQARRGDQHAVATIRLLDFVDYSHIDRPRYQDASFGVRCDGAVLSLIRVNADPLPAVVSFAREPPTVATGEVVTLSWRTRNTEPGGVAIMPEIGAVEESGSVTVMPPKSTTFTLRLAASGIEDVTQSVLVTVRSRAEVAGRLVARVKRVGGGWRDARGFSVGELLAAGVTGREAVRRAFSIDRRRRSTHAANVSALMREIDD